VDVVADIVERTDGIPLFVEEMTKAVLEAESEGAARRTVAVVPSPTLAVPASLHASLMARLDRLGPAKEVAQVGAAIGREFSHALLASVVRETGADLGSALERLIQAGLLFRQGVPPHATYLFKRALVQDATASSDGQYFRAAGRGGAGGAVNAKYGNDPGFVVYTDVSGRYSPFHTRVIAATVSEAPYVLDGLMHHVHQTDLRIGEHYTDTAGATDHVFGFCCLLGFQFAPEIRDLKDRKLYTIEKLGTYPLLEPLIGEAIDTAAIVGQWPELMRLKVSIEAGVVLPSVILRKLAAAGPSNVLSRALRVLGRIERTLFTLQWLSDPALRQRSHAGLNKGEASNSLRRAVFFHRQGEIHDRTFENQSFRASGLSLITAAIVHWNTVYLDRAVSQLRAQADLVPDDLLAHVAPLGWEHIAPTGDYVWSELTPRAAFRPLRDVHAAFLPQAA
jgi:TnpA family transposase